MPNFNPDFWEVPMEPDELDKFCNEDAHWYETDEVREYRYKKEIRRRNIFKSILGIIEKELTPTQCKCIRLYFFQQKTQQEISDILGISRRVVSQHIYGIRRNGKRIGGGINKIRKVCRKQGISM